MHVRRGTGVVITIAIMTLACALIAGTTLLAKALGTGWGGAALSPFQITAGRYGFALLVICATIAVLRPTMTRPNLPLHGLRSFCGWAGVTAMFAASSLIPLADAVAISFLNPIFTMLFAIPILKELVGPRRWGAALLCFVGGLCEQRDLWVRDVAFQMKAGNTLLIFDFPDGVNVQRRSFDGADEQDTAVFHGKILTIGFIKSFSNDDFTTQLYRFFTAFGDTEFTFKFRL